MTLTERLARAEDRVRPRWVTLAVVGAAWLAALVAYGWGDADLARDDLCYLTTLHDFLMGFEARKDYGHVGWGVLHLVGHSPLGARWWAEGRPGALLVLFATTIVPFCAYVAYRLARVVACMAARRPLAERGPGEPQPGPSARTAAMLAAWSPAVLIGAGTLGFWIRAGSVGFALLAAVQVLEYLEERGESRDGGPRRLALAVFLFAVGLALHPWALTGLAVTTPLLLARLWRHRSRALPALGALVACGVLFVGFLLVSGQGHRADHGASHLGEALKLLPLATAAHGAWQLPGSHGLPAFQWPFAITVSALLLVVAVGIPLKNRALRPVLFLAVGGLLAALPEATAPFPPRDWVAVWTGNLIKASVGMELLVPVFVGLFAGQYRMGRQATRFHLPRWVLVGVFVGISMLRAGTFLPTEREAVRQNAGAGGILGALLTASARTPEPLTAVPSLGRLARAAAPARFNPEVSALRRLRAATGKGKADGPYAGADLALWRTSAMRCELRLGFGAADGIVPDDPAAFHDSPCQRRPRRSVALSQTAACQYVDLGDKPQIVCPPGIPPHAGPLDSRDPSSIPLGLLGLAGIALGLALSERYTLASD